MSGPMATTSDMQLQKKRRAAIACTACHARKVRCNVVIVGQPCSNCQQDHATCALHVSSRGKHKRRRVNRDNADVPPTTGTSTLAPLPPSQSSISAVSGRKAADPATCWKAGKLVAGSTSRDADTLLRDEFEYSSNVEAFRNIVECTDTGEAKVPLYVGELQSLRFIFHVAEADKGISCKAHYLVPEPKRRQLLPEELACLEAKDAFSTETDELRNLLIALFFDYVYPILPIVDPADFFRRYDAGGATNVSPLLLQSIFLTASNFISRDALKKTRWSSVIVMKRRFYERAKALYDFEYETDKLCLIQSVLLLGYWLGNSHDRMDSWHWVGVATGLGQSLGLHRDPGCSRIPPSQRALWRRIWWCCFYRDRCIALGMGRAFRINVDDCDVKELTLEDLAHNQTTSSLKESSAAAIKRCNTCAPIFLEIIKLSHLLGDVLASVYRPRRREDVPDPASWSTAQSIEERLAAWQLGLDPRCRMDAPAFSVDESRAMTLHKYYLQILHHVIIITLYKPFVFQGEILPTRPESDVRARIAWEACQLSAFAATDNFRRIVELDMIRYLPPESVTMLITTVAILFLSKCLSTGMKWHLASQNLDLAMLVIQQLQEKYLSARFIFTYYNAAFEKVAPSQRPSLEPSAASTPRLVPDDMMNVDVPALAQVQNYDEGALSTAEVVSGEDGLLGRRAAAEPFQSGGSGQGDALETWSDFFPPGADFDVLFGVDGIFRELEEFDVGNMVA